jgi:hypothetical protein
MLKLITQTENEQEIINHVDKARTANADQIFNRKNYKNNFMKYKKAKLITKDKLDAQSLLKNGIGRMNGSALD